ncbi:MAG TPA: sugar ABC transporter permease [Fimbriimonadaceae bacterium]|nr:sugar ABC transporter permease [Fimbriimonadaceae bacterium]
MGKQARFQLSFLAPAIALFGLFVLWPLGQALYLSLFKWSGLSANKTFIGLENYTRLARDEVFRGAVGHSAWLLVVVGFLIFVLALGLAHAMNLPGRISKAVRSFFLFPHVMSLVAVAILWRFVFDPTKGGLANGILGQQVDWLGQKSTALPSVGAAFLWYSLGFYVLLFMAALSQRDHEVMEAAELDGTSPWVKFSQVTWPMIWSVRRVAVIYLAINVANVFALVWIMTAGGPDRATETMLTVLYQVGFAQSKFGYASAMAVTNLILVALITAGIMTATRRYPA